MNQVPTLLISLIRVLLLVCLLTAPSVHAHMLNMTTIDVVVDGQQRAAVTVRIDLGQSLMSAEEYWRATRAAESEQQFYLQPALDQLSEDVTFLVDGVVQQPLMTGFEIAATSLDAIRNPLTPQMATIYYQLDVSSGGVFNVRLAENLDIPWPCLLKITILGQPLPQSRLLTDVDRLSRDTFFSAPAQFSSVTEHPNTEFTARLANIWADYAAEVTWIAVGFQHILPAGLDHMLFILGLFFLAGGWRPLLLQVTCFTLAHSLTLGLSMYGIVSAPVHIVEPLIALSIVFVAVDNLYTTHLARWRMAVVCLFGLLHGLGFASVLSDIGLPEEQFLSALALFNLGVELGQVTVLAGAFLIVGWFQRQRWYQSLIAHPATIAIAGTGAYWFLKRIAF